MRDEDFIGGDQNRDLFGGPEAHPELVARLGDYGKVLQGVTAEADAKSEASGRPSQVVTQLPSATAPDAKPIPRSRMILVAAAVTVLGLGVFGLANTGFGRQPTDVPVAASVGNAQADGTGVANGESVSDSDQEPTRTLDQDDDADDVTPDESLPGQSDEAADTDGESPTITATPSPTVAEEPTAASLSSGQALQTADEGASEPQATATPQPEPTSTATASPTATAVPDPTAVPEPTATSEPAATSEPTSVPTAVAPDVSRVTGTVILPGGFTLQGAAAWQVQIQDTSVADAAAVVIGQVSGTVSNPGAISIAFDAPVDSALIESNRTYTVSARISAADGTLLFINNMAIGVITDGQPTQGVTVPVISVGTPPPTATPAPQPGPGDFVVTCSISNNGPIAVGETTTLTASVSPTSSDLPTNSLLMNSLAVSFEHGDGYVDNANPSYALYNAPGVYSVRANWQVFDSFGSIDCGTVTVVDHIDPAPSRAVDGVRNLFPPVGPNSDYVILGPIGSYDSVVTSITINGTSYSVANESGTFMARNLSLPDVPQLSAVANLSSGVQQPLTITVQTVY